MKWKSLDGRWQVETIIIDTDGRGFRPKFRVWHDSIVGDDGTLFLQQDLEPDYSPALGNSQHRLGPQRGAGGWVLVTDVFPASEVANWVGWDELEEVA